MGERVRSTILVVADDPGIQDALHLVLDDEYEVIDAVDGFDALAALASRKIDLMLLDLVMVHGDGFEVLEHWSREPKKLPIIVSPDSTTPELPRRRCDWARWTT
jgi:CheY-like chemotaxis protein